LSYLVGFLGVSYSCAPLYKYFSARHTLGTIIFSPFFDTFSFYISLNDLSVRVLTCFVGSFPLIGESHPLHQRIALSSHHCPVRALPLVTHRAGLLHIIDARRNGIVSSIPLYFLKFTTVIVFSYNLWWLKLVLVPNAPHIMFSLRFFDSRRS